jgi:NadR type nicotinamide-nucleotide adenylyltransferase
MLSDKEVIKIIVTGPESTGKTELAESLAQLFETIWIPEYARDYIEHLHRPYVYEDVIQIARIQIAKESECTLKPGKRILFFDTWLIITKVWLDLVFGRCPEWIVNHIRSSKIDLFLVCATDLPWIADPVRENGGEKREALFDLYCEEIRSFGFKYEVIDGFGSARIENALKALSKHGLNLKSF